MLQRSQDQRRPAAAIGGAVLLALSAVAAAEDAAPVSETHYAAARELLATMNVAETLRATSEMAADTMIRQNPVLAPYRDVILEWQSSFLNWETLEASYVNLYAEAFTEQELREMTRFYRTPVGRKSLTKLPELMNKAAAIGESYARDNLPALQMMIEERAEELQRLQQAGPAPAPP